MSERPDKQQLLGLGTIIPRAYALYKLAFKPLFFTAFLMSCLHQVLQLYVQQFLAITETNITVSQPGALLLVAVLIGVLTIIFNAVLFIQCAAAQLGRFPTLRQMLGHVWQSFPALMLASAFYFCLLVAGVYLFIIPSIVVAVFLYVYMPVILFDGASGLASIRRSVLLVRGQFISVAGVVLVAFLMQYLPALLILWLSGSSIDRTSFGIEEVLLIFLNALIYPLIIAMCLQVYFALKRISAGL